MNHMLRKIATQTNRLIINRQEKEADFGPVFELEMLQMGLCQYVSEEKHF